MQSFFWGGAVLQRAYILRMKGKCKFSSSGQIWMFWTPLVLSTNGGGTIIEQSLLN